MIFSHGTSNSRGVIVAFRHGLEHKMLSDPICDPNGRYIILNMEIQGFPYILVNCYAPSNEQEQIKLFQVIRNHSKNIEPDKDVNLILGGDWNLIFNSSLDAFGGKHALESNSLKQLYDLMSEFDLMENSKPNIKTALMETERPEMKMRRLDFFLTSDMLQPEVETNKFLCLLQSDHSPVVFKLRSAESAERGRGYWKFNNSKWC